MTNSSPHSRKRRGNFRNKARRLWLLLLGSFVLLLILWGLLTGLRSIYAQYFTKTFPAATGVLQDTVDLEAVILRDEEVIHSSQSGAFNPIAAEGQRVRKGEVFAQLMPSNLAGKEAGLNLQAPSTGLLSYQIDGLEGVLTRAGWENLDLNSIAIPERKTSVAAGNWVEFGQPLAFIIDNLANTQIGISFALADIPRNELGEEVTVGSTVQIKLTSTDFFSAKVVEIQKSAEKAKMIGQFEQFREDLLPFRRINISLVTQQWKGIVLPKGSLVYQGEQPGVYVLRKNKTEWRNVEILGEVGNEIAVNGLSEGVIVIKNPRLIKTETRLK